MGLSIGKINVVDVCVQLPSPKADIQEELHSTWSGKWNAVFILINAPSLIHTLPLFNEEDAPKLALGKMKKKKTISNAY